MSVWIFLALAGAGGVGSVLRFVIDGLITRRASLLVAPAQSVFPWGIFLVNLSGSLALGFVTEAALAGHLSSDLQHVLGTGLIGGYTTFSTASWDTVRLARSGQVRLALIYAIFTALGAVAGALLGITIGRLI